MPQHVPWVEVAVNERPVLVEDRALKDVDRPFPHRWLRRPLRQLVGFLPIWRERSHHVRCSGVDDVNVIEDLDKLTHPTLTR